MSTPIHYTYAPTTHAAKPTVKYGWPISAHPTSTHTTHSSTSSTASPHTTTVDPLVRTTPAPEDEGKPRDAISPLFIALVVLGVVVLVVAVVLIWGTWLKRRRQNLAKRIDEVEDEGDGRPAFQEKRTIREPELSWMTGPTLINEREPREPRWSAGTLVSQGFERGRRTTPPPIPPRAVNRRPVPVPGRDRELPSTPVPSTPLRTPVSPISPARRRPEVIDEDEILPVVDNDSYRPSPVSPLDSVSFTRSQSRR